VQVITCLLLGLGIGCVGGMIGIGGGVLLIPALTELFNFDQRKAAGMTLAAMVPPVTLPAVWRYYTQGDLSGRDLLLAGCIAATFALGAFVGASIQKQIDLSLLRLLFGLLMIYVAVRLLTKTSHEAASAAAGLVTVGFAWVGYLGLRALGRKHLTPPDLGEAIRERSVEQEGPDEYYI
jgi:uncharacterized membrane protein YfcA